MLDILHTVLLGLLVCLLIYAAIGDLRRYLIPNWLCSSVALLSIPFWIISTQQMNASFFMTFAVQLGLGLAMFMVLAGVFALGIMGGGDVKLMSALALWFPATKVLHLAILVSLFGGIVALGVIALRYIRKSSEQVEVPYGVAIAAGGTVLASQPILNFFTG